MQELAELDTLKILNLRADSCRGARPKQRAQANSIDQRQKLRPSSSPVMTYITALRSSSDLASPTCRRRYGLSWIVTASDD